VDVDGEHRAARQERGDEAAIGEALVVHDVNGALPLAGQVLQPGHVHAVEGDEIPAEHRPQRVLRQDADNPPGDQQVQPGQAHQDGSRRHAEHGKTRRRHGARRHGPGVDHVVGRHDPRLLRLGRALLDQGVERHGVQAAARREQQQVEQHAPAGQAVQHGGDGGQPVGVAHGQAEIAQEHRQADGGERHQPGRNLAPQQPRAQHGAGADAHGEEGQHEGEHRRVGVQVIPHQRRQLGQQGGAERPEPAQPQQRQPNRPMGTGSPQQRRSLTRQVPAQAQAQRVGRRARHQRRAGHPGQSHGHPGGRDDGRAMLQPKQGAAGDRAGQNAEEGAGFDEAVAGHQLMFGQVAGKDGVFQRAEERRLHAQPEQHGEQQGRTAEQEPGRRQRHERHLRQLDDEDGAGLLEPVGNLPGRRRQQRVGQDEHAARQRHQRRPGRPRRPEQDQHHQGVLEQVVVQRPERLGQQQRREAAGGEQRHGLDPF